jgi:hypothetical protein
MTLKAHDYSLEYFSQVERKQINLQMPSTFASCELNKSESEHHSRTKIKKGITRRFKDIEIKVFTEFVRNSGRSDREIARSVGVAAAF